MIPNAIKNFIEHFRKIPGLGPRAATRLAFFISRLDTQTRSNLIESLKNLENLERCKRCFFIKEKEQELCEICSDSRRDSRIIAIVEKDTDILTLEKPREFRGTYLILGELSGRGILEESHKNRIEQLKRRIEGEPEGNIEEIILAVNPHALGDMLYEILKRDFKHLTSHITRLGRGLPTGGEIEFADEETLKNALRRRS
ncbi:recombination protein RecR [bacterium]|nr:recombination protein RecR [bacterium]|tara:strand:- start:3833 stop:4432 length:600 start_codon:yes stop_codon:yes gene_type:complete